MIHPRITFNSYVFLCQVIPMTRFTLLSLGHKLRSLVEHLLLNWQYYFHIEFFVTIFDRLIRIGQIEVSNSQFLHWVRFCFGWYSTLRIMNIFTLVNKNLPFELRNSIIVMKHFFHIHILSYRCELLSQILHCTTSNVKNCIKFHTKLILFFI